MNNTNIIGQGEFFVISEYLQHIQDYLQEKGISPQVLLADTGLPIRVLAKPDVKLGHLSIAKANQNACFAGPSESDLIINIAKKRTPVTHGAMGIAALLSENVDAATNIVKKFVKTRYSGSKASIIKEQSIVHFNLELPDTLMESDRLTAMSTLITADNLLRTMLDIDSSECETKIDIKYPMPKDWQPGRFPFTRFRFNSDKNCLSLPERLSHSKLKFSDSHQHQLLTSECESELTQITKSLSTYQKVSEILSITKTPLPDVQFIAETLHLSTRSLRRKLQEEGYSYSSLRSDEMNNRAINYMKEGKYNLKKIAESLNYSDYKNFSRAFTNTNGMTPSTYQKKYHKSIDLQDKEE